MGFFSWLGLERKKNVTRIDHVGFGNVRMMARESRAYADEGYNQNVVVYRCVDLWAKSVAAIPLVLEGPDGQLVDKHAVLDLLKKPNPTQQYKDLVIQFVGFYGITGNSFLEALTASDNTPKELYVYPGFGMKVVEAPRGFVPLGYIYEDGQAEHKRAWEVDPLHGTCDLCHWKTFNPQSCWLGLSPVSAAAFAADQHNAASLWNKMLLANRAAPPGAWVTTASLTAPQFGRMKDQIETSYAGAANAGRPLLLEGGVDFKQFSLSPLDMDWLNGKLASAQDIAGAFGVPLQVVPLPGSQTFANYAEARLAFWEDTIIPLHENFCEVLSEFLLPKFGLKGHKLRGDLSKIPALGLNRSAKATAINGASYMTLNEKREELGLEPVDDPAADMLYAPAGMLPLGFGSPTGPDDEEEEGEDDAEEVDTEEDEDEEEKDAPKKPAASSYSRPPAGVAARIPPGLKPKEEAKPEKEQSAGADSIDVALNGAQITSVTATVQAVTDGLLSPTTAELLLMLAFPDMEPEKIKALVASAKAFTPVKDDAPEPEPVK